MANCKIIIPDDDYSAFALYKGYQDKIEDVFSDNQIDNPETDFQFAERTIIEWIQNGVRRQRAEVAAKAAAQPFLDDDLSEIKPE